jgi:DNA-binding transcriptional ArsR family regulator
MTVRTRESKKVAAMKSPLLATPRSFVDRSNPHPMAADESLTRFISISFRSVWSLELLLLLTQRPGFNSREELVTALRGSEQIVSQALEWLVAGGLVSCDREGRVAYLAATPELASLVQQTEDLYRRKPDAVRRLIVAGAAPGLTAFADAFRFRKD